MKRISQPFYRPKKGRWYVQLDGKQINLGADETGAWARYHEIMAERVRNPAPPKIIPIKTTIVASVLDTYLDWLKNRVQERSNAQRTYDWYLDYLQDFIRFQTDAYRMQDLLYAFRHSRITESLVNGLHAVTVSILAGHRDTSMISRHYAHLTQKHDPMREAANRATEQRCFGLIFFTGGFSAGRGSPFSFRSRNSRICSSLTLHVPRPMPIRYPRRFPLSRSAEEHANETRSLSPELFTTEA